MKTERVEKWLSLVANLAVLVGIVFLALEVQQSNRIAIAANEITIKGQFNHLNELLLANEDVAQLMARAKDANAEFTAAEYERLYGFAYMSFNTWVSVEAAYMNGMVTQRTFNVVLDDVREVIRYYPAIKPYMQGTLGDFPSLADTQVYATIREELADSEAP